MNREIKFRAWYEQSQTWVYFTFNQPLTDIARAVHQNICINGGIFYQFTGLKDKNGKDIYEGDILYSELNGNGVVQWNNDNSCFEVFVKDNAEDDRLFFVLSYGDVIGNIHENPAQ